MNDGISKALCSLSSVTVENAVEAVVEKWQGSRLAKVDICNAYRVLPIHPDDRWLLGMRWEEALYVDRWLLGMRLEEALYVDTTLPFGLRSALKFFTRVTDAVEWIENQTGWIAFCTTWMTTWCGSSGECRV